MAEENKEVIEEVTEEQTEQPVEEVVENKIDESKFESAGDDSVIKIDLSKPQLEDNKHIVNVVGMFFFDENILCLKKNDPVGERLSNIAKKNNILLMVCDQCAVRRNLAEGTLVTYH